MKTLANTTDPKADEEACKKAMIRAHKIKGAAQFLGFDQVSKHAEAIEQIFREADSNINKLAEHLLVLEAFLKNQQES